MILPFKRDVKFQIVRSNSFKFELMGYNNQMDYAFTCRCGFSTNFTETAKVHIARCIIATPPKDEKPPEPMEILAEALQEINEIISKALAEYKYQKSLKR